MSYTAWLRRCTVTLATLGIVLPTQILKAEQSLDNTRPEQTIAVEIPDVALGDGGLLRGVVVDSQGHTLADSAVVIRQGNYELVRTATNKDGQFAVIGLKGGVYQVATEQGNINARLWSQGTAPPSAKDSVMLVSSSDLLVRGQRPLSCWHLADLAIFGALIGAAIAIPIAVNNGDPGNNS